MFATPITVLDRAGLHTGIHVPPTSRQPKPKAPTASRFDRAAIMNRAWADYRTAVRKGWVDIVAEGRSRFAYCLRMAWQSAKVEVEAEVTKAAETERLEAVIAALAKAPAPAPVYSDPARAKAIKGELLAIEMSDAYAAPVADRELALKAELARLTA
jgi:hypothetical protein